MARLIRSAEAASAWVHSAGIAVVFPIADLVLPSLWEAMVGTPVVQVFAVGESGKRVFTPQIDRVWSMKNQLAERRLACLGKHIRGKLALISLDVLPALYALTEREGSAADFRELSGLSALQADLAEALLVSGPQTAPQLRGMLGVPDARAVKQALTALHRMLVATEAGERAQEQGWPAAVHDLLALRYEDELKRIPSLPEARATLVAAMLAGGKELAAADVAAALAIRRGEAEQTLELLRSRSRARCRKAEGYTLWRAVAGPQREPRY